MSIPFANWFNRGRARLLAPPQIPWSSTELGNIRVLLECPPEQSPDIVASVLERSGFDVVVCEGPAAHERCPLALGQYCTTVQGVDVVLNMLGTHSPERTEVLPAMIRSGPCAPAIVAMVDELDSDTPSVDTVSRRVRGPELAAALHVALADRHRPTPWWGDGV